MAISNPVTVATAATGDANPKVLTYNGVVGRTYLLCLGRYLAADSYTAVSDSGGNTWTRVTTAPASGTVGRRIDMWICTPTVPFTSVSATQNNNGYGTAALVEIQGSSGIVNAYNSASHSSSATPSPVLATPTKSNTLAVAICQANALQISQITPSSGWTAITSEVEGPKIVYRKDLPANTPAGVSWTFSSANGSATAIVYLEEQSSGGPWTVWQSEEEVPLTLGGMWDGDSIVPVTLDSFYTGEEPPPPPSILVGLDALPGNIAGDVILFPGIKYHRDFGSGSPTGPVMYKTGQRWAAIDTDNGAVMHLSWKGDPYLLEDFLDSIPSSPPTGFKGVYVSWWHEPEDDVRGGTLSTATFRANGAILTSIKNSHPKGHWILGCGPIMTRYDLDELDTDPAEYGWAGMDFYGFDAYQSSTSGGYYSNQKMFGYVIDKIHSVYPGIPILIPEYGMVKQTSDTTGSGRAAAITNHISYLRSRGDVLAIAYFNETGSIPGVPLDDTPSADAWRAALASQ